MLELALDQLAGIELLAVHAPGPVARAEKAHQVKLARFQGLEPCRAVFVDLDQDAVKVGRAFAHIQIARPVLRVTHVGDVFAKLHRADLVRAAANRDVGDHLIERLGLAVFYPPVAAEHRQATHGEGQLAVGQLEAVAHGAVVHHIHPGHLSQQGFVGGRGEGAHQSVEAVLHILRQHRLAVVKARLGPQAEGGRQAICSYVHIFGQQAVAGGGFVLRPHQ